MKAILILAGPYSTCEATKIIWQDVCGKNDIDFEMYDSTTDVGKELVNKLNVNSFPAFIIDDKVVAVGHPNEASASKVIDSLLKK